MQIHMLQISVGEGFEELVQYLEPENNTVTERKEKKELKAKLARAGKLYHN